MKQLKCKIIKNIKISKDYALAEVLAPEIAKSAKPGQFVMVQVRSGLEPLLRRPLGIHQVQGKNIQLLYEIVGKGTQILSRKNPGEILDVIGPLGNGFDLTPMIYDLKIPIIVAGGMGVAPLTFLAQAMKSHKVIKSQSNKIVVLIGAKTKNHINCEKEFKKLSIAVKIATDDGSKGYHGRVTELLKEILVTAPKGRGETIIFGCGPKPMLRALAKISDEFNIPAQISLEAHMSCGFGACLGCVVDTTQGYKRVCKDGPVFKSKEIIW